VHAALLARYAKPHRAYHTLRHLGECLVACDPVPALAPHAAEVEMALWFKNAIYDVHRHANEPPQCARWAREAPAGGGVAAEVAERVEQLVLATQHTAIPQGADARLLVDIDRGNLGADEARFAEYEQQIRAEYAHVPEPGAPRRPPRPGAHARVQPRRVRLDDRVLWDVARAGPRVELGARASTTGLAFVPGSARLASGHFDGSVVLAHVDIARWPERACAIANRNLTREEWHAAVGDSLPYRAPCSGLPVPQVNGKASN